MGTFQRRYSDDQRTAVQQAWGDRNIRPAKRIVQLAAEGELTCDGELLPAFAITEASARDIGERYVRRLKRAWQRKAAQAAPRDAVELLRRRFVAVIDEQLAEVERRQARKRHGTIKPGELQQLGKALRELASLPGPSGEPAQSKRPPSSGEAKGLSAAIRASMGEAAPVQSDPHDADMPEAPTPSEKDQGEAGDGERINATDDGDSQRINAGEPGTGERINAGENEESGGDPGEYARAQIAQLAASSVSVDRA